MSLDLTKKNQIHKKDCTTKSVRFDDKLAEYENYKSYSKNKGNKKPMKPIYAGSC